ncbi:sirohydrochlorin chelatase [Pseudonocardia zijingensis]|jgi:sirohydrochlorin ferrochelatase|uniref:Sirohydrochlorin chelatase n=1 Tax=Pseudonocardia zijingensis TaxID=153376 RepID=A0ABP3YKM0_9PSEU
MAAPALVAVAHGSRDPRSAATVSDLIAEVRRQRPGMDVRLSFLDLSAPRLPDVLDAVAADGHRSAVVVPLLLGHAFHARVDVPSAVTAAAARLPGLDIEISPVIGGHEGLSAAALRRLAATLGTGLHDPGLGVVLAAIGSSHAAANAAVADLVAGWTRRFGWHGGSPAFAAMAAPTVTDAVAALRASGAQRVAVAQWILAPGLLPDRIVRDAEAAGASVAAPLGPDPDVAHAILARYDALIASKHFSQTRIA